MDFDNIIGQKEIVESLKNSIKDDRVGHAYIFSGPKGIGKKTVARIFAGLLLCEVSGTVKSCGGCLPCRLLSNKSNPDFHEIDTDGSSIGVEEIRNLQSGIVIRPLYSARKVYLIIDADKMTVQAQNCLLKTLEEPPGYSAIILTTANAEALLETIRSRAVRYNFRKNTFEEIRELLDKQSKGGARDTGFIVSFSDGVIGTALELFNSEEFIGLREKTVEIIFRLQKAKLLDVFDLYAFFESSKGSIDAILDIMLMIYRDLLVFRTTGKENILINSDKKDIILRNAGDFPVQRLIRNLEAVESARRNIKHNANYQLSIEVMLMKLQEENG